VAGSATIRTIPDVANVTFTIKTLNDNAKESQEENKIKSNEIYKGLEIIGVEQRDTKTQSYTVRPIYESIRVEIKVEIPAEDGEVEQRTEYRTESIFKGYETVHTVVVTVNDTDMGDEPIALVGKIVDLSITNGAFAPSNGVSFSLSDNKRDVVYLDALDEASLRANQRAKVVMENLGVTTLRPLTVEIERVYVNVIRAAVSPSTVNSGGGGGSAPAPMAAPAATPAPGGGGNNSVSTEVEVFYTPIAPGEVSVTANVSVLFTY